MQDTPRRSEGHERIPPGAGDYFVIQTRDSSWFYVSTVMARAIDRRLDRWLRPRWITFVDLSGARIRLRADDIISLVQSTVAQRADRRAFDRESGEEERTHREPDTDSDSPF